MTQDDVEILNRKTAYQGFFRIESFRLRHRLFQGGWGKELSREVFDRGHAVAVALYDPDRDSVVMIEQFRVGALAAGETPWVIETVAGIIEPGEQADAVARRETLEETGCRVSDVIRVCHYLVSPGATTETVTLFCARVDSTQAMGIHGVKDEGEDIRVFVVPLDQALADLAAGRIVNSLTIIGLQWLALNRDTLKRRWR